MFLLSSISSGLQLLSVNHTSKYDKLWVKSFLKNKIFGEISNNWPNNLLGPKVYKTCQSCWQLLLAILLQQFINEAGFHHSYLLLSHF